MGFMFLKMDMKKAFDKMEWNLILVIMQNLGFYATWIHWIKACISTTSFSILLNSNLYGMFALKEV